jgi:hypothetical protein
MTEGPVAAIGDRGFDNDQDNDQDEDAERQ